MEYLLAERVRSGSLWLCYATKMHSLRMAQIHKNSPQYFLQPLYLKESTVNHSPKKLAASKCREGGGQGAAVVVGTVVVGAGREQRMLVMYLYTYMVLYLTQIIIQQLIPLFSDSQQANFLEGKHPLCP